jgi:hypothetical protein
VVVPIAKAVIRRMSAPPRLSLMTWSRPYLINNNRPTSSLMRQDNCVPY